MSINEAGEGRFSRSQAEMLRARLREVARACGPPDVLIDAVKIIEGALPASSGRLAALMYENGLTEGLLHPGAVQALARLWVCLSRAGSCADEVRGVVVVHQDDERLPQGL